MNRDKQLSRIGFLVLAIALFLLAYFTQRSASAELLTLFCLAFAGYLLFARSAQQIDARWLIAGAVALRVLLLFAPITWTDDHFRYLWDGICSVEGIQPFAHTPREVLALRPDRFATDHFSALNSPDFHTVYPPLAQGFFALAAFVGNGDVWSSTLVLRVLFIACDVTAIILLLVLLKGHGTRLLWVALYAFNPLVLMELSVNLHTEALMIPLCLGALLLFQRGKLDASAIVLGLAASARLWPLIFLLALPALPGLRSPLRFGMIAVGVFLLSWLPLYTPDLVQHFLASVELFHSHFEFNGGLYELLRKILGDEQVKGTGLLGAIALIGMLAFAVVQWRRKSMDWAEQMLWLLTIHFIGSQAVHPWYILPLVAFGVLNGWYWPIAWTLLIVPTYLTYGSEPYSQPYGWIAVEYALLVVLILLEHHMRSRRTPELRPT